jgi:hypothetical protein
MIEKLYSKYFQKSKSFLYPILGIRKNSLFPPINTYLGVKNLIEVEDIRLICIFKEDETEAFKNFEDSMLLTNPLFQEKIKNSENTLYVFNLEVYQKDWANFIMGKYSKLSSTVKKAIKSFYGENSAEYKYIQTYLYPEKFFEEYSKLLDMDVETLKNTGELCNPFDMEKETLEISLENLEILK